MYMCVCVCVCVCVAYSALPPWQRSPLKSPALAKRICVVRP